VFVYTNHHNLSIKPKPTTMKRLLSFSTTLIVLGLFTCGLIQAQIPISNSLTIIVEGHGSVLTSWEFQNPAKAPVIICDQTISPCSYDLPLTPLTITLTATADEGWVFTGFSGVPAVPIKNANSVSFRKDYGNLTVTANFEPLTPMPVSNWAIYVGIALIVGFLVFRFRRVF
jgi:hypothetical protein